MSAIEYTLTYNEFVSQAKTFARTSDLLRDEWLYCEDPLQYGTYLKKTIYLDTANGGLKTEYIVSYNVSYAVPLLSFNAWCSTGALISLEEFVGIKSKIRMDSRKELYSAITQQEHPVLRRPYLTVHPCRTAALLASVASASRNILVTFLSVMAPLVGIDMNLQYGDVEINNSVMK